MSLARFAFTPRFPTFWRDVDELFANDFQPNAETKRHLTPPADVLETEKTVEIHLDMPGIAPEQIDVKLEGNTLTITAERKTEKLVEPAPANGTWVRRERGLGTFVRSFTLGDTIDGSKPEATYRHGVLTVTLPKREEVQPRSLKVKVEA